MLFRSEMAATSLQMLTEFGMDVTLRRYNVGSSIYDPTTGIATPVAVTDTTRKALITEQPGQRIGPQYGATLQKGSLVQEADKWIYMDANGPAPALQDHVIFNDIDYNIVDVQETAPGGIPLLYLLVLRT